LHYFSKIFSSCLCSCAKAFHLFFVFYCLVESLRSVLSKLRSESLSLLHLYVPSKLTLWCAALAICTRTVLCCSAPFVCAPCCAALHHPYAHRAVLLCAIRTCTVLCCFFSFN